MATQSDRNDVRPSLYWVAVVLIIGLFAVAIQQWRATVLREKETQQLKEELSTLEGIKAENINLQSQCDRLLRAQDLGSQQIQSLGAEIQQLRERTNEMGIASLAHARTLEEAGLLKTENLSLKVELASKPRVPRIGGWLGVTIRNIPKEEPKHTALSGVVVTAVVTGSPANQARLQVGDVVVSVDGQSITGTDDFKNIMVQKVGGQQVALGIIREDSIVKIDVEPLDWPQ